MGMIKRILQSFRPIYMEDPFFGRIEFEKVGFWVASPLFKPLGTRVEVLIGADENGPVEADREFYREIERRYETLFEVILDAIIKEAKEEALWKPEFSRESLRKDLRLDTININPQDQGDGRWDITCWVSSIRRMATLLFRNWTIEDVLLEC